MWPRALVLLLLAGVVALPFVLRRPSAPAARADEAVVIITPHNEAIRQEFGAAFQRWYRQRTGRTVAVDWRVIGGTSEITRFLRSEYTTAFEHHWRRRLGRPWGEEVLEAVMSDRIVPDDTPADDTPAEAARREFLRSSIGVGIDLFFGGGSYDLEREARAGRIVDSGIRQLRPEWFRDDAIPETAGGERYWDAQGRWVGTVVAGYGLLYNRDSLRRLGVPEPRAWADLTDPRLRGEVALADPTKSSSIAKAFEMVIQQEIQRRMEALRAVEPDAAAREARAVREGWLAGLRILQLAGANARYFTDSSQKPPIDIAQGSAAVGMCIDFYGRYQEEAVTRRDGSARLRFITPPGGSVFSVDPIAMLRGAPNRAAALAFIEFTLSLEGQSLWNQRPGTPGGPELFALRRLPVRKDWYADTARRPHRSDPDVDPFADPDPLVYHAAWTGGLFRELAFIIRVMSQDTHLELKDAWTEIVAAGRPAAAMARLTDLSAVDYDQATGPIRQRLAARDKLEELALAKELGETFRANYAEAAAIARQARR